MQEVTANKTTVPEVGLEDLNIGPPIAKGCSAVVYAASFREKDVENSDPVINFEPERTEPVGIAIRPEMMSPIQNTSRFIHNFGTSVDNLHFNRNIDNHRFDSPRPPIVEEEPNGRSVRFNSKANVTYHQRHESESSGSSTGSLEKVALSEDSDIGRFPLALKMMFNYDIQSNAMAILRAMYKETIPALSRQVNPEADGWEKILMEQSVSLPAHPNIVLMYGVFCAQIPNLRQSNTLYPMALPPRLNPQGYGRNMSLFLLMKRYNNSLQDYLNVDSEISMRSRLLLFAQLLEAIAHLYRYGVSHRDLKADNILIDTSDQDDHPVLVLSDFGCCLADKNNGLTLPYTSHDMDKGGNTALMAPEIITKTPGTFSVLDYTKSILGLFSGEIVHKSRAVPSTFAP